MNIRQSIVNDLITAFGNISVENGYRTDIVEADIYHWHIAGFEEKDDLEVINIKDGKIRYEEGEHILEVEIILGAIKTSLFEPGDTEQQRISKIHQFITNRALDIYQCLESNWSVFREKYGFWIIEGVNEDLSISQEQRKISEMVLNIDITYKREEKYEPELRNF